MIRFIDLTGQIYLDEEQVSFAFFDTVRDKFCEFNGCQRWDSLKELMDDFDEDPQNLIRYVSLIPDEILENI